MSNISKIKVGETTYDIEDTVARSSGGGLSNNAKTALLALLQKVAYIDANGQTYYDALESALYPPANLVSISAVYTQTDDVYTTDSLDVLKSDLVVSGLYDDSSTRTIVAYTLSGTLTEGTSTITVSYGGETTTFSVIVSVRDSRELLYKWDFTKSLIDTVNGVEASLINSNNGSSLPTRDSSGLHFTGEEQVAEFAVSTGNRAGHSYEFDISSAQFAGDSTKHKRLFLVGNTGGLVYRNAGELQVYNGSWVTFTTETGKTVPATTNDLSGKKVKFYLGTDGVARLYINGELIGSVSGYASKNTALSRIAFGGATTGAQADGNQIHNMTITALRVYNEEAQ